MVEVDGLTKRFGRLIAVDDVSFHVRAGESFALLGPNGSGKTTTLKCLAGLAIAGAGRIEIGGIDARRNPCAAAALFSYLPQRVAFPDHLTALEVLEFYSRLRRLPPSRAAETLASSGLASNGATQKTVSEFSGGMVQRLGIAVAFLPRAPLLLLDEPALSLDPQGATAFRDTLRALKNEGTTIIFSTHVLSDAELLADRVAILVAGRLAAVEEIDTLRNRVAERAQMRVLLDGPAEAQAAAALRAGADTASVEGNTLRISCGPQSRMHVLHALEQTGAVIRSLYTEEPSLEEIYLRYVNETGTGNSRNPVHDRLP